MDRKPLIIAVALLFVVFFGVWAGKIYLENKPDVSREESEILLDEYKENISESYRELNTNYEGLDKETQATEWEGFSRDWMQNQTDVRPPLLDKKLPKSSIDRRNLLMAAQNELLPLWTEYNKAFTGKSVNEEKISRLKQRVEDILKNT
jgi:hypothetical protein